MNQQRLGVAGGPAGASTAAAETGGPHFAPGVSPADEGTGHSPRARRGYDSARRAQGAERTRRAIAEAALALFVDHDYEDITLTAIARKAGVSHQTVLNHFQNKAGVVPAAAALFSERVRAMQFEAVPGDVGSVVRTTCARYEQLGDLNVRWAELASRLPEVVVPALERSRANFQGWLLAMLGELMPATHEPVERTRVLLGLHAALDVFTWKLFRRDIGLSQHQTERQMTDLALGVLARHRPGPGSMGDD